jgi:hypothetical protein
VQSWTRYAVLFISCLPAPGHAGHAAIECVLTVIPGLIRMASNLTARPWRVPNKTKTKRYSIAPGGVRYYSLKSAQKPIWLSGAAVSRRQLLHTGERQREGRDRRAERGGGREREKAPSGSGPYITLPDRWVTYHTAHPCTIHWQQAGFRQD